jgi:N-acylneuraminate cytidylyltransferase
MKTVALVPARGGSRGLPGKNLAEVGGRSLVRRAVEVALAVAEIDEVVVSSDAPTILEEGARAGAVPLRRPAALAADDTPTAAVVADLLARRPAARVLVLLQPTAPLREPGDVRACLAALATAPAAATVAVLSHPAEWLCARTADGLLEPLFGWAHMVGRRQDAAEVYTLNGAVYAADAAYLRAGNPLVGPRTAAVVMPPERSVDVDDAVGLALARVLAGDAALAGSGGRSAP